LEFKTRSPSAVPERQLAEIVSVEIERIKTKKTCEGHAAWVYGAARRALQCASDHPFFVKQQALPTSGRAMFTIQCSKRPTLAYFSGDITTEEFREEMLARLKRA